MKKIFNLALLVVLAFSFTSCFKDSKVIFNGAFVEFEEAVTQPQLALLEGQKIPSYPSFPVVLVQRTAGERRMRVNLVAAQQAAAQTVTFQVDADATEAAIAALRSLSQFRTANLVPAVAGTHFTLGSNGSVTIPANSSFGDAVVNLINTPASTTPNSFGVVVFTLVGNDLLKPNTNYKRLGIRIPLN